MRTIYGTERVTSGLYDIEDGLEVSSSLSQTVDEAEISLVQSTTASGHLTVTPVVWNQNLEVGNVDCGIDAISLEWAFDESQPVDIVEEHLCGYR